MRVLQINNFEDIGGGSDRVYQLTTKLLLDRGHEVATLACGSNSFDARKMTVVLPRNGYVEKNPLSTLKNIRNFVARPEAATEIENIARNFRPDIAHLHIFYGQLSNSVLAALRRLSVPIVMTVHEYRMLCPISTMFTQKLGICERCATGNYTHAIIHRCNRGSLLASSLSAAEAKVRDNVKDYNYQRNIDHFFMVSSFCRDKHIEFHPEIAKKSSVLYNFVTPSEGSPQPPNERYYLYCGRLSHEKGLGLLCEAFAKRPHDHLKIAGDGPLSETLRNTYSRYANIQFLGKLDTVSLQAQIRGAWFTIAPSEWYENNPMSILESFSAGTPVIAAAIGGIPELVHEGRTGLLFKPSSAEELSACLEHASALSIDARMSFAEHAIGLVRRQHTAEYHYGRLLEGYELARRIQN